VTRRGWLLFVALCVIWGIPYLLIKVAVREISPASLVFLRTAIGALVLLPVVLFSRSNLRLLLPRWRPIVLFTVVELAIPWLLLSDAERRLTSSLAGLLVASVPLVGVVLARMSGVPEPLGDAASPASGRASPAWSRCSASTSAGDLAAVGEMVLVVIGYALGPMVVSRRLTDVPALDVVAVSLALGAVTYAPVGIAQLPPALPAPEVIFAVVVLGVICTAVAFVLFFRLIAEIGPVRATVVAYVNPAVAVAAGVAVLGEPLTVGTAVGFVLILAGSWLATGSRAPAIAAPVEPVASSCSRADQL
jgi:drug/metabolite transporter (DMT)-like permease